MPRLGAIHIAAQLKEQRGSVWSATLANGHCITVFPSLELKKDPVEFHVGEWVITEISPFDLTEGCILKLITSDNDES